MITDRTTEAAEAELNRFIERRALRPDAEQQRVEELFEETTRRHREQQRERHRWEWVRYFELMAENHARLSEENRQRAAALIGDPGEGRS